MWLFGLLRLRHIPLFLAREAEAMKVGDVDAGSTDILMHDYECGVVVLDCTRNIPSREKGARLRQSAQRLSEAVGEPVRCGIICAVDVEMLRESWGPFGVALISDNDLGKMRDLAEGGNIEGARAHLFHVLNNLAPIGRL